jgi:PAS domain S-box-containing protein
MNQINLQNMINASPFGFAHHKVILDAQNNPVDYRFIEVNPAFEKITGLKADYIVGKTVREAIPGIEKDNFDWIGLFGKVAINGGNESFEQYLEPFQKWYRVHVYSGQKNFFTTTFIDITPEKTKQMAIDMALSGVVFADSQGKLFYFNDTFLSMFGYQTPDECYGKTPFDMHPETEIEKLNHCLEQLATKGFYKDEIKALKKSGEIFDVQFSAISVNDGSEEPNWIMASFEDITERKQAEAALRESEQKSKSILENSRDIIWSLTWPDMNILFISPAVEVIYERSAQEFYNDPLFWQKCLHPDDQQNTEKAFEQLCKYGYAESENRVVTPTGQVKWVYDRSQLIYNEQGYPIRVDGTVSDITARKKFELELQKSNNFQKIIASTSSRFLKTTPESSDTDINEMLASIGHYFQVDRAYLFLFSDDHRYMTNTHEWCAQDITPHKQDAQEVLLESLPWWQAQIFSKEYIHIPCVNELPEAAHIEKQLFKSQSIQSLICIPIKCVNRIWGFIGFDAVNQPYCWSDHERVNLSVVANLTADHLRKKYNEKLLIEAKLEAEAANKVKSEFVANMSHEIRTPLNGVIGFTDLLKNTPLTPVQQHYLDNANVSGRMLLGIINDILDFSKIEAGMLELETVKTDMVELLENSVDIVKFAASKKNIEMLLDADLCMPRFAWVDSVRLKQILANLLGNAVKFTEQGEVELKVRYASLADGQGKLAVSVRDTGIGISETQKNKLFKAFSQGDSSTTRKFGGTGLGLIISDMIAKKMGSKIHISSIPSEGTTFYFDLVTRFEEGEPLDATPVVAVKRCLVIDDNANNRLIMKNMLLQWQIECETCHNSVEALQRLATSTPFDVVICDYNMPDRDGLETIRIIREQLKLSSEKQPVILLHSSSDDAELHQQCESMGIRFRLTKPVKSRNLFNYLCNLREPEQDLPTPDQKLELELELEPEQEQQKLDTKAVKTKILIAEDVPMNIMLIKILIQKLLPESEIYEATTGLQAVEHYKTIAPDMVFMDVQMPELDGLEATMQIRAIEAATGKHVPIIALTAGALKEEREDCFAAGMDDFIPKPIEPETVKSIFDKFQNHGIAAEH